MIITRTPLRVGLVGGGTDLPDYYREHGGRVLNAAIDKYVYVVVKQRFDDDIYVNYSSKEIVSRVEGGEGTCCVRFDPSSRLLASACSFQGGGHVRIDVAAPQEDERTGS